MREQRQRAVADQIGGGFVSGHQQQQAGVEQFAEGKRVSFFLGLHQRRDQILPRRAPPHLHHLHEIGLESLPTLHVLRHARFVLAGSHDVDHVIGPALEVIPAFRINPQHLGDHDHRQRIGEVLNEVEGPFVNYGIQQLVRDHPDTRLQL